MDSTPFAQRFKAAHDELTARLDELLGSGVLLDPEALRTLRAAVDAALPVAEAYERYLTDELVAGAAA